MTEYWNELMSDKTDTQKKVYEGYLKGIEALMKKTADKPILEFTQEELYNAIMNGTAIQNKGKVGGNVIEKPLANYIKTAYMNLCILIRDKNGLATDYLRSHTKRRMNKIMGETAENT